MTENSTEVAICGAGIAGVSAAYHLAVKHGIRDIVLIDEIAPLSLTSDNSTECYRNWWPGPGDAMVALMNRSIDLLEQLADESGNVIHLNRRGYLYCTAEKAKIEKMQANAEETTKLGAGLLRVHTRKSSQSHYLPHHPENFAGEPNGADLILDNVLIQEVFPYLSKDIQAVLHVRRAGWLSAQQLGMYLFEQARSRGARFLRARITGVDLTAGGIASVHLSDGRRIDTSILILAPGPLLKEAGRLLNLDIPVYNELHLKAALKDTLGIVNRSAPLLIWNDSQILDWDPDERKFLLEDEQYHWLLNELPAGVHMRPEGGLESQMILLLWEYQTESIVPVWPVPVDPYYPEIVLRGLTKMIPDLATYIGKSTRPRIDGGYYTKTSDNRPLIGKLPISGAYIISALSGYGIMASCAAGELLAAHVTDSQLPSYASAFSLDRFNDPEYQMLLKNWGASGQL